ncbi:2-oxoglutarate ferredoxin oxidoreductase subunit alpha [Steroidobacter denitrificans]|uniref:2-oxoglutarate ferredoxin oxidoreductase subunit alpha n=1 Tax=Steroidobacter denitrificans TaxID=465721 RepID=A0A127FCI2_STEDE|nr:2-oxoglutarate ferredoxin oxidoreductase subunit alpha [Steroidobacter denitrificans]
MSAATMLVDAAGKAQWYALMTRSVGAQIRGGETAALIRFSTDPVAGHGDDFQVLLAFDWQNLERFASEIPLSANSLVIGDLDHGAAPEVIAATGARYVGLPLKQLARTIPGGRPNMVGMGVVAGLIGLPLEPLYSVLENFFADKGDKILAVSKQTVAVGYEAAAALGDEYRLPPAHTPSSGKRWSISGNQATGLGALRGGIRFVAAYPITPATEVLEWMAGALPGVGGALVQVEDELAAINQIVGASYGGTPALTATAGPGLSLMIESLGLAVAAEVPLVVVDVMRGGPSTGIPAKSEQADLNIAIYGLHGDAPHLVLAPNSVTDCIFTTQWATHLSETLQAPAIVLSDQYLGQTKAVLDRPPDIVFPTRRELASEPADGRKYLRYADTPSGVSPMATPGMPGCQYTADGLEHDQSGAPSSRAEDHLAQMNKRARKLADHDYGDYWADLDGEGDLAIVTWGSSTGAVREAASRWRKEGGKVRVLSVRLLAPVQPEKFQQALAGVSRILVVEQSHGAQFYRYLRAYYDLPQQTRILHQPGPLPFRPHQICEQLSSWRAT